MNTDFEQIFDNNFDVEEPNAGHFERFQQKFPSIETKRNNGWKWFSIAASIILIFGIAMNNFGSKEQLDLSDISPKMEETQDYFTTVIRTEIEKINARKSVDNANIIEDAFVQLKQLEGHYVKLTSELKESDGDKRVIFAMISNYQQRIEVLQDLLQQLENLKNIKSKEHENFS